MTQAFKGILVMYFEGPRLRVFELSVTYTDFP